MASVGDSWMREYNEASKLAEDINSMISERGSLPPSGPETQRHSSTIRRKITILGTRLDSLSSLLSKLPKQPKGGKEFNKRQDMLTALRSKAKQMATALNMSNFANREDLFGPGSKPVSEVTRTEGLDNREIVFLQRKIIKEQDDGLEQLEETVLSTKHIALAVNEELNLHTRLIVGFSLDADSIPGQFGPACELDRFSSSEGTEEIGDSQQAHEGRMHYHVPASLGGWHCHARHNHLASH